MSKAVLGIDVAKKTFEVFLIMLGGKTLKKSFSNNQKGFGLLNGWLKSLQIDHVHACLEATGTYSEPLAEFLYENGHTVSIMNPLRIKSFASSDLRRNKTDVSDARTIAEFCLAKDPKAWNPLPPEIKQLQALSRRIESLEEMLRVETNRLEQPSARSVRSSLKRMIANLKKEIKSVEELIKEHIDNNPDLKHQSKLLQTIPGIAEKTARFLLGEVDFRSFDSARALAAHAGVTPGKHKSGTSIDWTRLSKIGNGRIRKALYFPAIAAKKHNKIVKEFAERLSRNGKTKMQVICAAIRKLLHIAFGVIKNNRPFEPNSGFHI